VRLPTLGLVAAFAAGIEPGRLWPFGVWQCFAIAAAGGDLSADFLKLPHHGSKTSSTAPFLSAVHPRIAVISVGAGNARGHRSEEVVDRYGQDSVRLLRTDRDGAVTAMSNDRRILVSGFADATRPQTVAQARN
jgi:beta-lactamase superfamily II metal-dependent hydrolase